MIFGLPAVCRNIVRASRGHRWCDFFFFFFFFLITKIIYIHLEEKDKALHKHFKVFFSKYPSCQNIFVFIFCLPGRRTIQ